jgi:hypothetical protein
MAQIYDSSHSGQEIDAAVDAVQTTIPSQLTQIGSKLGDLTQLETTDKSSLVGAINEVAAAVISAGSSNIFDVTQSGFYFVDSNYNIGAYFDNSGFHAINMIEYEEVNNG